MTKDIKEQFGLSYLTDEIEFERIVGSTITKIDYRNENSIDIFLSNGWRLIYQGEDYESVFYVEKEPSL